MTDPQPLHGGSGRFGDSYSAPPPTTAPYGGPNPYGHGAGPGSGHPGPPPKDGSGRKIAVIILTIFLVFFGLFVLVCAVGGWFLWQVEDKGPGTSVVSGAQMKDHHVAIIEELGLLESGEEIQHFYSDALIDIRDGMYFLTNRHLILYKKSWRTPAVIIPYRQITSVDYTDSDSWLIDSTFVVTTEDEDVYTFPVSIEGGGHHRYYEIISDRMGRQ